MNSHLNAGARQGLGVLIDFFALAALLATASFFLGAYHVGPAKSSGYAALGDIFIVLLMLALKGIGFVLVPAVLGAFFLRLLPGLAWRLWTHGALLIGCAATFFVAHQNAILRAEAAVATERLQVESARQQQSDAAAMAAARSQATVRESQRRSDLLARAAALTEESQRRWREDVQAAGAYGPEGQVPPMLAVLPANPYSVKVTNLGPRRICLSLVRVLRKPGTSVYEHCGNWHLKDCVDIPSRVTRTIHLFPDDTLAACTRGLLEYRVGTYLEPEPSWWSISALDDFERHPPDLREKYSRLPEMHLRGEVAQLEKSVSEPDRAARWRRELGAAAAPVNPATQIRNE